MDDISAEARRYLQALRRRWWVLLAAAVVGAVGMILVGLAEETSEPILTQTMLSTRWSGISNPTGGGSMYGEDSDSLAVGIAKVSSQESLERIEQEFGVTQSRISFGLDGRRYTIVVIASDEVASQVADQLAEEIDEYRSEATLDYVTATRDAIERRLAEITDELNGASEAEAAALLNESEELETQLDFAEAAIARIPEFVRSEVVRVINTPAQSDSRIGAGRGALALAGFATGAVLAGAVIAVIAALSRRVSTRRDVEQILGQGTLVAVVPDSPSDTDLAAAAAAVVHVRQAHPDVRLVELGASPRNVIDAISARSGAQRSALDDVIADSSRDVIAIAEAGKATRTDLERMHFVLSRAGGMVAGVILVASRRNSSVLD